MLNNQLIEQLKRLKTIEPDPIFKERGRVLILARTKKLAPRFRFSLPILTWSGVFAAVVIILTIATADLAKPKEALSSSFDSKKLNEEFSNLNVNIQLNEIKYQQNVNQTINSALTEISQTQAKHLNQSILQKEASDLDFSSETQSKSQQIDQLLDNVLK